MPILSYRRFSVSLAALFLLATLLCPVLHAQLILENARLQLAFDEESGNLLHFNDLKNGHAFVETLPACALWELHLLPTSLGVIRPAQATQFSFQQDTDTVTLTWQGFGLGKAPQLKVSATILLVDDTATSQWRIRVEGLEDLSLASVRYPRIPAITEQENEVLAVPVWMGEKSTRARTILTSIKDGGRFQWGYPGILSLQCAALYQEDGPGFYVACDDTTALGKNFAFIGNEAGQMGFELVQLVQASNEKQDRYESPYNTILGSFEGDWFTAAEIYRSWAKDQVFAKESRLKKELVADWVTETGLWVWNRDHSDGVLKPAVALQQAADMPVSVFWHWWHGCAYDMGFPEYLPPREGVESFTKALDAAHASNVHAIVYMNQRLWGMTTQSWIDKEAERYAVKQIDGTVRPEVYNTFTKAACASMCMGTAFWRNTYSDLATAAVNDLDVDGIYMDQACSSLACYDPTHGHPLGGGGYWMNGFKQLQADIRERTVDAKQVTLAGEGCGEAWLPYLDLMLSLQVSMERYAAPGKWDPIPFFHAVYHDSAVLYGNYSSLTMPPYDSLWPAEKKPKDALHLLDRKYSKQYRMEQARSFVWGQQPTLANFRENQLSERSEEIAYLLQIARLRYAARKYLMHGVMLRPPALDAPMENFDMSRLSIYAGQGKSLKEYQREYPILLASAWQAPDGDIAVALANISDTAQPFAIALTQEDYPLPDAGRIHCRTVDAVTPVADFDAGEVTLTDTLPAQGLRIYEIRAVK